jgi:membrane-associated PAP2 superfamily phosphatase
MSTIVCLHPEVKEALIEVLKELEVEKSIVSKIKKLTDCDEKMVEFGRGGSKVKRAPSAYQQHTSECMKAGHTMAECAAQWKKKKGS